MEKAHTQEYRRTGLKIIDREDALFAGLAGTGMLDNYGDYIKAPLMVLR